ncbi:MAG: 1,4-alpha-glucan branching protein GlgB [Clostridia bacterium]|nr:1,4-alpha-glucan branching protein GlgB [Clostridia bacterium]
MQNILPDYLFHQGTNFNAYDFLGAHCAVFQGKSGVFFRVWAPNAKSVSVIGDFNGWNNQKSVMNKLNNQGVWELFVEGAKVGDKYKFAVLGKNGKTVNKSDPYAFYAEKSPNTASIVYDLTGYNWQDENYLNSIKNVNHLSRAINIYEVNLASWKRKENGDYLTYTELIDELVPYVKELGYTHVEFMPVSEYPFDGSWGYQVTGYYAITSRFGTPKEFMALVDAFHKENIGVIVDWVPAHFPKDEHGLFEFDGQPLYEYQGKDRQENENWGTRYFDLGREQVQSFLVSNAVFFFEKFHIDGLRVDAVASMLYLDYDKRPGEWTPNIYGDNVSLEAIAFFHKLNKEVFERFPYALMIAEESSSKVKVTGRICDGGLGFNFKWNMGWMNDVLSYMSVDPVFRSGSHNKLSFSLCYAFSENFILPISHDEVVHGKKSLLDKMPGEYEEKFANNRAFVGYEYLHPGKKLTFMGEEFGQFKEWDYKEGIERFMTVYPLHYKLYLFYKDVNDFYKNNEALYSIDDGWGGFEWRDVDNKDTNVIAIKRTGLNGQEIVGIVSFNGTDLNGYELGVDGKKYVVRLNSNDKKYGGDGRSLKKVYNAVRNKNGAKKYKIKIDVPKLSFVYLEKLS